MGISIDGDEHVTPMGRVLHLSVQALHLKIFGNVLQHKRSHRHLTNPIQSWALSNRPAFEFLKLLCLLLCRKKKWESLSFRGFHVVGLAYAGVQPCTCMI